MHDFLFYINVIISYSFKEFAKKQYCRCTEGHHHLIYIIATAIGWTIPRGPMEIANLHLCIPHSMGAAILILVDQVMYDWLNYTTWFHSNRVLTEAWNLNPCCFIFLHNTVANMLCRLFDDLGKQKNSLYFLASACEHLWPSHLHLVNCAKICRWLVSLKSFFKVY